MIVALPACLYAALTRVTSYKDKDLDSLVCLVVVYSKYLSGKWGKSQLTEPGEVTVAPPPLQSLF